MAEKVAARGWTDTEKVGLFLQIIAKGGPVPWPELILPDGRTVKACQVMLDKEKQKIKKAREAAGEDVGADVTSPKKRKAVDVEGGKARKGRKDKATADESDDDKEEAVPRKKGKATKKKKISKAQVNEYSDAQVKDEDFEEEE